MKLGLSLVLVGASLLVMACSKGDNAGSETQPVKQDAELPRLEGKWTSADCTNWGKDEYLISKRQAVNIVGSSLTSDFNSYKGETCSGDLKSTMKMKMKFELSKTAEITQWYNIDVVSLQITEIVYDQDTANIFNTTAYCGYTDWIVGEEKIIGDRDCMSGSKLGETIYSIIKITDTEIQVGTPDDQNDGTSPQKRHKTLGEIYKKVPPTFLKPAVLNALGSRMLGSTNKKATFR